MALRVPRMLCSVLTTRRRSRWGVVLGSWRAWAACAEGPALQRAVVLSAATAEGAAARPMPRQVAIVATESLRYVCKGSPP